MAPLQDVTSGVKRQRLLSGLAKVLRVPANGSNSNGHHTRPRSQPLALVRLGDADPDKFDAAVQGCYYDSNGNESHADISMYGDGELVEDNPVGDETLQSSTEAAPATVGCERDDIGHILNAASDNTAALGSKGFNALCDTGASVSVISVETLKRMGKGFTKFEHLHPDQKSQLQIRDFTRKTSQALGLVSLLWYLDKFPKVTFNTPFWVVESCTHDVILGQDVKRTARLAVEEAKREKSKGPGRFVKQVVAGSVSLLLTGKLSRHNTPSQDSTLREDQERMSRANGGVTQHR